jgi:PTS system mannose-specific IID component
MHNLGFAFSIAPVLKRSAADKGEAARMLQRHLQLFSTNPYMSGPIIGSVIKVEEELSAGGDCPESDTLKSTLMAPYAAMGDSLFWGSLKPFAASLGVLAALKGFLCAPLVLLFVYNPVPVWVRAKGFFEGYRKGKNGIEFIQHLNLPLMAGRVRWMSAVLLGVLAVSVSGVGIAPPGFGAAEKILVLGVTLLCYFIIRQGISSLKILYGAFVLFLLLASVI